MNTAELLRQRYNERIQRTNDIGVVLTETVGDLVGAIGALTHIVNHMREVQLLLVESRNIEAQQLIDRFAEEHRP